MALLKDDPAFKQKFLSVREVQDLMDRATGYGIDVHSRRELAQLQPEAFGKHILTAPETRRVIREYNKTRTTHEDRIKTEVYKNETYYNRMGIMRMVEDKGIQEKMAVYFHKASTLVNGVYLPNVVCHTHPIANPEQEVFWI